MCELRVSELQVCELQVCDEIKVCESHHFKKELPVKDESDTYLSRVKYWHVESLFIAYNCLFASLVVYHVSQRNSNKFVIWNKFGIWKFRYYTI